MKVIFAFLATAVLAAGADAPVAARPTPAPDSTAAARSTAQAAAEKQRAAAAAGMAAALQQQRLSISRQLGLPAPVENSPFLLPRLLPPTASAAAYAPPPCDPLPAGEIDALLQETAKKEAISADLLRAVVQQESGFRPCAVSSRGAMGLMQLMPATVTQLAVADPFDPRQNIESGARLLKQLLERYGGNIELALGAYNAGPARVDASGGVPAIEETLRYVQAILATVPRP